MNDNDIIKALECCISEEGCSDICPYHKYKYEVYCMKQHGHDLLGLINRQKAEIEELRNENLADNDRVYFNDDQGREREDTYNLKKHLKQIGFDYDAVVAEMESEEL